MPSPASRKKPTAYSRTCARNAPCAFRPAPSIAFPCNRTRLIRLAIEATACRLATGPGSACSAWSRCTTRMTGRYRRRTPDSGTAAARHGKPPFGRLSAVRSAARRRPADGHAPVRADFSPLPEAAPGADHRTALPQRVRIAHRSHPVRPMHGRRGQQGDAQTVRPRTHPRNPSWRSASPASSPTSAPSACTTARPPTSSPPATC